jgi:hypothetical protein
MASDDEHIQMGAGGYAGFFLAEDMINGTTNHSDTFNNEILAGSEFFRAVSIEVWELV